jgi:hypothetical protein
VFAGWRSFRRLPVPRTQLRIAELLALGLPCFAFFASLIAMLLPR